MIVGVGRIFPRYPKGFPCGAKSGEIYFSVTKLRKELVFGKM